MLLYYSQLKTYDKTSCKINFNSYFPILITVFEEYLKKFNYSGGLARAVTEGGVRGVTENERL